MKKMRMVLATMVAMSMVQLASAGGDANQMNYVSVLGASALTGITNAAVDVSDYKGNSTIVVNWGTANAAAYTGTVTVTHSTSSTGTYSTVTNLAGTAGTMTSTGLKTNEVDTFAIDLARLHKYMKVNATHAGATNSVSAVLVAPMKAD